MDKPILLFAVLLGLIACSEKDPVNPDPLLSYPLEPGTEWVYSRDFRIYYYESEASDKITGWDSIRQEIRVWIEKDTLVQDTLQLVQFVSQVSGYTDLSKEYYRPGQDGLTKYAYENPGMIVFVKKGGFANSFPNFVIFPDWLPVNESITPDLYFYSSPRLAIMFPLDRNSKWTYLLPAEPQDTQIDKEVTAAERVKTPAGSFDCFRVNYLYINNPERAQSKR
ncbi:MAG: hypothetical protein U0T82_13845, partial [Bacteroidales bacterium]